MYNQKQAGERATTSVTRALARNVRFRREQLGLTCVQLAQQAGTNRSWIGHIERGHKANITIDTLVLLAKALKIDPALLIREDPSLWMHTERRGTKKIEHRWYGG